MKLSIQQYTAKYRDAHRIVPAIKRVLAAMNKAKNEGDMFSYSLLKRLRSWMQKIYCKDNPRPLKGEICKEWLENPEAFVMFISNACEELNIPTDDIEHYKICRKDTTKDFEPFNISLAAPASIRYAD